MSANYSIIIRPALAITGSVRLPGDKSISHRYAMLAAIAEGSSRLENFATGADCASTLGCVRSLGVGVSKDANVVAIEGKGSALRAPAQPLDCGNSGSTMRMFSGILAGQDFTSELVGDESLTRRPMARVIEPLRRMGAEIASRDGRPPLEIKGGRLKAIDYQPPVSSAQVKTSLLFAGLFAEGETRITEAVRTRDHGEVAMRSFGAEVSLEKTDRGNQVSIRGGQKLHGIEAQIPGDLSSAAFFLCATALLPGSQLVFDRVLMNPTRARLLDILVMLGLQISVLELEEAHGEPVGTIQAKAGTLRGATIAGADSAALIDEIPVLAAIAPFTENGMEIRDAKELRVKESDRIAAIATNLRKMGAEVDEREDGLRIPGRQSLHGAELDSFGDHRIAMAFAIAALRADGDTKIANADAAIISYPAFFETLESLIQR